MILVQRSVTLTAEQPVSARLGKGMHSKEACTLAELHWYTTYSRTVRGTCIYAWEKSVRSAPPRFFQRNKWWWWSTISCAQLKHEQKELRKKALRKSFRRLWLVGIFTKRSWPWSLQPGRFVNVCSTRKQSSLERKEINCFFLATINTRYQLGGKWCQDIIQLTFQSSLVSRPAFK